MTSITINIQCRIEEKFEHYLDFQVCEGIAFLIQASSAAVMEDFEVSSVSEVGTFRISDERNESAEVFDALLLPDR